MNIVIENGRVIDPKNGVDRSTSLFIADGKVAGWAKRPPVLRPNKPSMQAAASSAPA
jgi:predicted amidohydrolase